MCATTVKIANGASPLCTHVSQVIGVRTKEQVRRVATRWIITTMANQRRGLRYLSNQQHVRNTMGLHRFAFEEELTVAVDILSS